uniref:Uncharacterized protein n=1 Tax=Rhizophora mucronata TaxID=61149 RepID=A0A2P2NTJ0_RHIMU
MATQKMAAMGFQIYYVMVYTA